MPHPELGPIALICALLPLIALPAQIRARSIPTIALVFWLSLTALVRGVNAIAWTDNAEIKLIVWCDIVTRIQHGFAFGVPGAALCIMVQLESIASSRSARSGMTDNNRKKYFEYFMCYGFPIISIILYYVIEGHRFDIYESFGCYPTYVVTVPTLMLFWLPPLIISVISMVFGGLVLYHFIRHRLTFTQYLSAASSSISVSRYIRLMALSSVEIAWELAANIYILQYNVKLGLRAYDWDDVHYNFGRIAQFPRWLLPDDIYEVFLIEWWIVPAACMAFFLFFGTGEEAMKDYRLVINWVRKNIFRQTIKDHTRSQFLPTYSTTSRGTVKTNVASPYSAKGGKQPWEDINIKLPAIASTLSDDGDSYGGDTPITPMEKTDLTDAGTTASRFSAASDMGITVSEIRTDSRPPWPSDVSAPENPAATPTMTAVTITPPPAAAPTSPSTTERTALRFGDIRITVERESV